MIGKLRATPTLNNKDLEQPQLFEGESFGPKLNIADIGKQALEKKQEEEK